MNTTDKIFDIKFGKELDLFLQRYYMAVTATRVIKPRHRNIWPWLFTASRNLIIDTVPERSKEDLLNTHTIAILLNVMLDEIADLLAEETLLDFALRAIQQNSNSLPLPACFDNFRAYLSVIKDIWDYVQSKVKILPNYPALAGELDYAFRRYWQHLRNSAKLNCTIKNGGKAAHMTLDESLMANGPSMFCLVTGIISLMSIENFFPEKIKEIEEFFMQMECCAVLSNSMTTWRAEVRNRDFTSSVILWALENEIIGDGELARSSEYITEKIDNSPYQEAFCGKMQEIVHRLEKQDSRIQSFSTTAYIQGMLKVYHMHLQHANILSHNA
jgi:hypothetical protein